MTTISRSTLDSDNAVKIASNEFGEAVFHMADNSLIFRNLKGFFEITSEELIEVVKSINTKQHHADDKKAKRIEQIRARRRSCKKCGGSGHINGLEHIEGGRCFKCS